LVVFQDHVLIFSDKDCEFPDTGSLELDWNRWFRRAVQKSADQVWGAERWIKSHPSRLFLDRACTQPFPIEVPDPGAATFHRIVVAHKVSERCRQELGGSGSLMIDSTLVGAQHYAPFRDDGKPFTIGQLDPARGYVHVLDDTSLAIVMNTLNTITDFVTYLSRKEKLICSGQVSLFATGEEDLLAFYLGKLNEWGEHDFIVPDNLNGIAMLEGLWEEFADSPERQSQIAANEVSYSWDALIEAFNKHILAGTQYYTTHLAVRDREKLMRFLAREPRTRRRMLAKSILQMIAATPINYRAIRVMLSTRPDEPHYVFRNCSRAWGSEIG